MTTNRRHHLRWYGRTPDTWPIRASNVRLARLDHGEMQGCAMCFPHGRETINNRWHKDLRCWKRYRLHQYHGVVTHRRAAQHRARARTRARRQSGWHRRHKETVYV